MANQVTPPSTPELSILEERVDSEVSFNFGRSDEDEVMQLRSGARVRRSLESAERRNPEEPMDFSQGDDTMVLPLATSPVRLGDASHSTSAVTERWTAALEDAQLRNQVGMVRVREDESDRHAPTEDQSRPSFDMFGDALRRMRPFVPKVRTAEEKQKMDDGIREMTMEILTLLRREREAKTGACGGHESPTAGSSHPSIPVAASEKVNDDVTERSDGRVLTGIKTPSVTVQQAPAVVSAPRVHASGSDSGHNHSHMRVKPDFYDGVGMWTDYQSHFEACSDINGWTNEEKASYLAVYLRGQARKVLTDLPDRWRTDYQSLVTALRDRFSPENQTELHRAELKSRTKTEKESYPELGQAIRRLVGLAYPMAPHSMLEVLAHDHFIDAITESDLRLQLYQGRPTDLKSAVSLATELEAILQVEKRRSGNRRYARAVGPEDTTGAALKEVLQELKTGFTEIKEVVRNNSRQRPAQYEDRGGQRNVTCFMCNQKGHYARECPQNANRQGDQSSGPLRRSEN